MPPLLLMHKSDVLDTTSSQTRGNTEETEEVGYGRDDQKMDTQGSQSRETTNEELRRRLTNASALRFFSILLWIGEPHLMRNFVHSSLTDVDLPFQRMDVPIRSRNRNSRPHQKFYIQNCDGSIVETKELRNCADDARDCPGLWDTPSEGKWKLHPDQNLVHDCVLPFVHSDRLNWRNFVLCDAGGRTIDTVTYRVTQTEPHLGLGDASIATSAKRRSAYIDADFKRWLQKVIGKMNYRRLDLESEEASIYLAFYNVSKGRKPNDFAANPFAPKMYDASMTERTYAGEPAAFRRLQLCNLHQDLRVHGSFTRDATYNVLVEYGDGSPEEYFRNEIPAAHTRTITQFWKDMSKLAEALKDMHKLNPTKGHSMYSGMHTDIKIENILWSRLQGCGRYERHGDFRAESFLDLNKASDPRSRRICAGRHGDIKPENILWFQPQGCGICDGHGDIKAGNFLSFQNELPHYGYGVDYGRHGDLKPEKILWFQGESYPQGCGICGRHRDVKPRNMLWFRDEPYSQGGGICMHGCVETGNFLSIHNKFHLHDWGIFDGWHSDVKPDNILSFRNESYSRGNWTLADFGVSTFERTAPSLRNVHKALGPGKGFPAYSSEGGDWKTFPLHLLPRFQDKQQRAKKDETTKRLGTRRLAGVTSYVSMRMQVWFTALIGVFLSGTAPRNARPKAHGMQAMLMSLLLWTSPVAATSVEKGVGSHCSSFLSALHLSLNTQLKLFTTPQPPFPRSFPASTLILTTLLATTITVLVFVLLSSKAHTKTLLLLGVFASAAAGAVFAKDVPDLVFRYLFAGLNGTMMFGVLAANMLKKAEIVTKMDVEAGDEKAESETKIVSMKH